MEHPFFPLTGCCLSEDINCAKSSFSKYLQCQSAPGLNPWTLQSLAGSPIHVTSNIFCHGSQIYTSSRTILLNSRLVYAPKLLGTSNLRLTELSFPCPVIFSEASLSQYVAPPFTPLLRPESLGSSFTPLFLPGFTSLSLTSPFGSNLKSIF